MALEKEDILNLAILGLITTLIIIGSIALGSVSQSTATANLWLILLVILSTIFIPHI